MHFLLETPSPTPVHLQLPQLTKFYHAVFPHPLPPCLLFNPILLIVQPTLLKLLLEQLFSVRPNERGVALGKLEERRKEIFAELLG